MSALLSICIPTRNRPAALQKTVNTIQGQVIAANALHKVEILISDNTDTESLRIDPGVFPYENIRYMSNKGNIGYARNVNKLIVEAQGQYVWLLADDDIVLESAVQSIVDSLEAQKEPIYYLTFYSGAVWGGVRDDNFYFKNCTQHYFAEGKDFLEKYWRSIIFISVNIFHREKMISHARQHDLFNNRNDVYQNSLMGISFVDTFGHVKIIPKTLLFDSYDQKLYTPFNSVSVPVLEYVKLLTQLGDLGVNKVCLASVKKDVDSSILSNGLRLVIRKIETADEFDYAAEFRKVINNKKLFLSSRIRARLIYTLFQWSPLVVRPMVKLIYMLKGKAALYATMRKENIDWYKEIQKKNVKVSYG